MAATGVNLLDVAAQLLGNNYATGRAAASGTLRDPLMKDRDSVYTDKRFVVGLGASAINLFSGNAIAKRVSLDIGAAALHSLVATENIRRATTARMSQLAAPGPQAAAAAAPRQLPAGMASPVGQPVRLGYGQVW